MLTITETIDALRAIDTDEEVLKNACKRILGIAQAPTFGDPRDIANVIVEATLKYPPVDTIRGMAIALAATAAAGAKKEHEHEVLQGILGEVTMYYAQGCAKKFLQRLDKDPNAAMTELMNMLRDLGKGS